jgi:hypothetical protein
MTWFERLTGFSEVSPDQVRANLILDGASLRSRANGRVMVCGQLETPSLAELRERVRSGGLKAGRIAVREVVADVRELHADESNAGALFQVASQFNLLEMVSPDITPEQGIGRYEGDPTQGPACAIAAGAGTIYRNYFAPVNGRVGQSADNQIECLADVGAALGNSGGRLWEMKNGYALATERGLVEISERLRGASQAELDALRGLLRIGIQWNAQVTLDGCRHLVSQAYCSALPVGYSSHPASMWEGFARLVLEAAYEATLCAAIPNSATDGDNRVFLTLLGGGVFGNQTEWIIDAILRALKLYQGTDLEVAIVSFGSSRREIQQLLDQVHAW